MTHADQLRRAQDEITALRVAVVELFDFIEEIDPDPEPVEAYIRSEAAQIAARRAVEIADLLDMTSPDIVRHRGRLRPVEDVPVGSALAAPPGG